VVLKCHNPQQREQKPKLLSEEIIRQYRQDREIDEQDGQDDLSRFVSSS
jgi:hypothetical protein